MGQVNTKLTDTPNTPSPGYAGIFISTGLVPTLIDEDSNEVPLGGATNFTELLDVPSVYTGQSGKVVTVNGTEDGLEFTTSASSAAFVTVYPIPSGELSAAPTDANVQALVAEWFNAQGITKGASETIGWEIDGFFLMTT
jgi:hypothetical protein